MNNKGIVLTAGDPFGVGYEIILKCFLEKPFPELVVIGSKKVLEFYQEAYGLEYPIHCVEDIESKRELEAINVMDIDFNQEIHPGKNHSAAGKLALDSLKKAIKIIKSLKSNILVTAPINKANIAYFHPDFTGHTEFLAQAFHLNDVTMMLTNEQITVALVTTHLPIEKVKSYIHISQVENTIIRLNNYLQSLGYDNPKIAVCGLNPHAGDRGLLGTEEEMEIQPAIQNCQEKGILCEGPFPADGLFAYYKKKQYHGYVAMYHDQGLIPVKMAGFKKSLNITLGLPFIRISVDHGTAFDIAGKGIADHSNMMIALNHALYLYNKV